MKEKMKADLFVQNANQMCTLEGPARPRIGDEMSHLGTIPKAAVAVRDGRIIAIGSTERLKKTIDISDAIFVDATGKTIIPGLVDAHTHALFAGTREDEMAMRIKGATYMDILKAGGGILRTAQATRCATKKALFEVTKKRLERMQAMGTTTVEVKSGYGLSLKDEVKCLEVISELDMSMKMDVVPTFMGAHAVPLEFKDDPKGYVDLVVNEMVPVIGKRRLARFCDIFCEKGIFDKVTSERVLLAAKGHGMVPKIHCDEMEEMGGTEVAVKVGAISAEHLAATGADGIKRLAKGCIIGVLLPGTPFVLMHERYPDARAMIEGGMSIALATDLNPNCWTESMPMVMTLACLQMRMSPEEALSAATINAAYAIGMGKEVGSIEVGKKADLVIMSVPNYQHIPYRWGSNHVEMVIKEGKVVVCRDIRK